LLDALASALSNIFLSSREAAGAGPADRDLVSRRYGGVTYT
jgi:hypothetical protein